MTNASFVPATDALAAARRITDIPRHWAAVAGASVYLEPRFEASQAIRALRRDEISILQGVPMMFRRLLSHIGEMGATARFPRLRYLYTGGGPPEAGNSHLTKGRDGSFPSRRCRSMPMARF